MGAPAPPATGEVAWQAGELFENVVGVLSRRFFDADFRGRALGALAREWRPAARSARSLSEEVRVVRGFLSRIPVSHLALLSAESNRRFEAELANRSLPTVGFTLVELAQGYFVSSVLEGGPAERAGLRRWDRILEIDGVPVARSERLDLPTDDAYLPDPPSHDLLVADGEVVTLRVERTPGIASVVRVRAEPYSSYLAAKASVRTLEVRGRRVGIVHFRYMHTWGAGRLLADAVRGPFARCDGLVLDLRGRGGSTATVASLLAVLQWANRTWGKPVVVLVDRGTRSAKEILAYEIRRHGLGTIVGEETAGAVIPATFQSVSHGMVLMFPSHSLGEYTRLLEGQGVEPDVPVPDAGPFSAGADPIFDAAVRLLSPLARRTI